MTNELIAFYILGVIISYPVTKYLHIKTQEMKYSQFDRLLVIFFSLFSWLCITNCIIMVIAYMLFKKFNNKKADW